MNKFWHRVIFWEKLRDTCGVLGGGATTGLHFMQAADIWVFLMGLMATIGVLLGIWAVDHDNNGTIDWFE